jgi:hypothetical protein
MPRVGFETVWKIGLALPGVEKSTTFGTPSLKVRGRLLACRALHRSAEPGSLVLAVDIAQRDDLIAADPDVYYVTDHYVDYATVLVRLSRIHHDALRDLMQMGWRFVTLKTAAARQRRKRSGSAARERR